MVQVTRLWPFKQSNGFIESLQWQTDLLRAKSSEQRIALRGSARREFNYSFLMTDFEVASAQALVAKADIFLVPDWAQFATVSSATGTTITADTSALEMQNGDRAILWESSTLYEQVDISTIVSTTITVDATIQNAYTNARLMPLVAAHMPQGISVSRRAAQENRVSATFEVYENRDVAATTYATYQSYDLMDDDRVVGDGSVEESVVWDLTTIDNMSGIPAYLKPRSTADMVFSTRWILYSQSDVLALRKWFHARRGRQKVFWASTKAKDLEPASAAAGTALTVYEMEGTTLFDRTGTFDIQIEDVNGTLYNRRVNSYSVGTPVGSRATVNLVLDAVTTIAIGDIVRISFLRLCRLNSDRVEFDHSPDGHVIISVPMIEVPVP